MASMDLNFIPGLELSRLFFVEAVQPLLADHFPDLRYTAARLDRGSEVLGFDTPMSMDHGWGPKLTLFLDEQDFASTHAKLHDILANHLPFTCHGFPTNFSGPFNDGGQMELKESYPLHHMVTCTTPERFFRATLHINIHEEVTAADWLTFPHQRLRTIRAGQIYYDGLGSLETIRDQFHWYPKDLWLYLMASQWQRISQEAPFLGRTGIVGDELGSHLLADRLIIDLMNLAFLVEREYAPYWKWFGTAFQQLALAKTLTPIFEAVTQSRRWEDREHHLTRAYLELIRAHNDLKLTPPIQVEVRPFYQRPFLVPPTDEIIAALQAAITDPEVTTLPIGLGNINQISDNTDLLDNLDHGRKLKILYS
jgi:hypothetical protein